MTEMTELAEGTSGDVVDSVSEAGIVGEIVDIVTGLLPILLPLVAVFIGIKLVPSLIRRFSN